jgi:hypothetical protein
LELVPPVQAQDDASIAGIVRDITGAGIDSSAVHIKDLETGTEREVTTDQAGRFHAPSLLVGRYEVVAEKAGFRPQRRSDILLVGRNPSHEKNLIVIR